MTLHWTIISNGLTQKFFRPIGARRNLFDSSSVWSYRTSSDICKNGWYLLLRCTIR